MKTVAVIFSLISGAWSLLFKVALVIIAIVVVVGFINSCAANATLSEHSSCQQFEQADTTTQNKVLQDMMNAHHDQSFVSTVRFSVTLYCDIHDSSSPIDGVYSSGNVGQQPAKALHISAPLTALLSSSQAWSKASA
jgi:hypothetical protein